VESIEKLRRECQSVHSEDVTVQAARAVSVYITWLLIPTGVTGNAVSVANVFVGVAGGLVLMAGQAWGYAAGFALLVLNVVLDSVDGEMARYRKQSSLTGLFADRINSIFLLPAILAGTGVGLYREYGAVWILFVAFIAAWGFNALRLVKTSIDTTLVDALTLEKARQEDTSRSRYGEDYVPFSEHLRSKKKLHLSIIDLLLVRSAGFVLAAFVGLVGHAVLMLVFDPLPLYYSPALYLVAGYAALTGLATPAAIALVLRSGRIETTYDYLTRDRDAVGADGSRPSGEVEASGSTPSS
jgi:phosphatidylglycerophosphate synthase